MPMAPARDGVESYAQSYYYLTAGWVPAACVVQLVYTAYKNIGTTTMQSFQGIFGTTMACLNAWMLTYILRPEFRTEESS